MARNIDNTDRKGLNRQRTRPRRPVPIDKARIIGFTYISLPGFQADFTKIRVLHVIGDSLIDVGIVDGDWLAFNVTKEVLPGQLAVLSTPYGSTVKFIFPKPGGTVSLVAANKAVKPYTLLESEIEIWGVVIASGRDWYGDRPERSGGLTLDIETGRLVFASQTPSKGDA